MSFKSISAKQLTDNPFKLLSANWMLITAGDLKKFNMMTASWGGFGFLWEKNICFCVIRPNRYTFEFVNKNENFTLSFFEAKHKKILKFCGENSGKDVNKIEKTGLTPLEVSSGAISFEQARLIISAKKIYFQDLISANFLVPEIEEFYPQKDYHRMFVGEILEILVKE